MARPKAFNPDEALEKAMHVFWHKGYEATSMEDLLPAMNISRSSFYDTFGDKRQLFLQALDRYRESVVKPNGSLFTQEGSALLCLRQFLDNLFEWALMDPQRRGCLVGNTIIELGPHERDVAHKLNRALKLREDTLFHLLTRAKAQGELRSNKDPRVLARVLVTMILGTAAMIKVGTPAKIVKQTVSTALSALIG